MFDRARAALLAATTVLGCAPTENAHVDASVAPDAHVRLSAFRARYRVRDTPDHAPPSARVDLPRDARSPVRIEEARSRFAITFTLEGASASTLQSADGLGIYAGALDGADVVERVHTHGVEDYVAFETKPSKEAVAYVVDVSHVAGLRLVERTLEFLDADGAPRLRVAPPTVADATGTHDAMLAIEGCSYDTNPAAPWGRPVVAAGAASCRVLVSWNDCTYPAVVDPQWSTTGAMTIPRTGHSGALLSTNKVLIAGGYNAYTPVASAELYDPSTQTFAATGSMTATRTYVIATRLGTGKILIAGSFVGGTSSADLYDPNQGTFSATGSMTTGRSQYATALLGSGKVLIAGGAVGTSAELYDPSQGTFALTGNTTSSRTGSAAAVLPSGKVLVAGGQGAATSAEIYDPSQGTFTATGSMSTGRTYLALVTLASGKVLAVGGSTYATAELYDPTLGTFSSTGNPSVARLSNLGAALLPTGKVVCAGGFLNGLGVTDVTEVYDPNGGAFALMPAMATPRGGFPFIPLSSGKVLAAGGSYNSTSIASAELFADFALAAPCATNGECESGFCVDGVCCATACSGQCEACDVQGFVGTCTPISGTPHGSHAPCVGAGTACAGTCSTSDTTACGYPSPSVACGSTCSNSKLSDNSCDGQGHCVAGPTNQCPGNFVCDSATTCKTTCALNVDCETGYVCVSGACVAGGGCIDDHTSAGDAGAPQDCTPFKCDTTGACKSKCASVDDCVAPNVCNNAGQCVSAPSGSGGCNASGSPGGFGALVVILGVLAKRKRALRR